MKKYYVELVWQSTFIYEVEAENEDDAKDKAYDLNKSEDLWSRAELFDTFVKEIKK